MHGDFHRENFLIEETDDGEYIVGAIDNDNMSWCWYMVDLGTFVMYEGHRGENFKKWIKQGFTDATNGKYPCSDEYLQEGMDMRERWHH